MTLEVYDAPSGPPPARRGGWLRRLAGAVVLLVALWLLAVLLCIALFRVLNPPISMVMIEAKLGGETLRRQWVPIEQISPLLTRAVIASEDGQYCSHWGVDWGAVRDAMREAAGGRDPRGASTIPMQTVKNLFMWQSRSYVRKVLEVPLAYIAMAAWGKQRTMEIYLNIVEWGPGVFGAEAASRYHFGKSAAQLSAREAALLAAALPSPTVRSAGRPGPLTRRIAGAVERRMPMMESRSRCALP